MQTPTRVGYYFKGWSADRYGTGTLYGAGSSVRNLGGKIQGSSVTLYAAWAATAYTVRFSAGADDASGEMQDVAAEYGKTLVLPLCEFERADYDFIGWARTQEGNVAFGDGEAVFDLTSDGGTFTLYAVWEFKAEYLRAPFENRLRETYAALTAERYVAQDWNELNAVYRDGMSALIGAGKDTARMDSLTFKAELAMRAVPTESARASEIVNGWKENFSVALACVQAGSVAYGKGAEAYAEAGAALDGAQ